MGHREWSLDSGSKLVRGLEEFQNIPLSRKMHTIFCPYFLALWAEYDRCHFLMAPPLVFSCFLI